MVHLLYDSRDTECLIDRNHNVVLVGFDPLSDVMRLSISFKPVYQLYLIKHCTLWHRSELIEVGVNLYFDTGQLVQERLSCFDVVNSCDEFRLLLRLSDMFHGVLL